MDLEGGLHLVFTGERRMLPHVHRKDCVVIELYYGSESGHVDEAGVGIQESVVLAVGGNYLTTAVAFHVEVDHLRDRGLVVEADQVLNVYFLVVCN